MESHSPPGAPASSQKGTTQLVVLLVALVLWSVFGKLEAPAFIAAYVGALVAVHFGTSWLGLQNLTEKLTGRQCWMICLLLVAAPIALLVREFGSGDAAKAIAGTKEFARDKLYLQDLPCIFPALVRTDQPQRFFIYSPGNDEVTVCFGPGAPVLRSENLGHGLFLLDYDPRNAPLKEKTGPTLRAVVTAGGVVHERSMRVVRPRSHPRWFSSSPSAGIAATVSEETDELIIVQRNGKSRRVEVDDGPTDCALFAEGKRAVVCHKFQSSLCIVDTSEGKVIERRELSKFQTRLAASPDGKLLAVALDGARRGIQFMSLPEVQKLEFVELPFSPDWIAFGRDAGELVITDRVGRKVFRLSASGTQWKLGDDPVELTRPAVTMCRGLDGAQVIFSATAPELGREPIWANHYIEDTIHHLDLATWKIVDSKLTHRGGMDQDFPGTTEHGVSPMGMTFFGDSLLVAFAGTNEVGLSSPATGTLLKFRDLDLDDEPLNAPHGVADLGEGMWCVSSPVDATIGIFDSKMELKHLVRLASTEEKLERNDPALLKQIRGERTFFETTRAGLSCQSCHLHTDTDHCQHSLGADELVDVLTVHGVAGTSPYLREGPYAQLRGLHEVADQVYRGYASDVDWDRAEALEQYMSSLPPMTNWRTLEPHDSENLRRGMDAFVKAQCIQCHVPPAMTNLGQHPANLVFPDYAKSIATEHEMRSFLDVPSLRSVSLSPPFLHDGRAPTLESIFTDHNPSGRHGDSASLSKTEFRALIDFLEQL